MLTSATIVARVVKSLVLERINNRTSSRYKDFTVVKSLVLERINNFS